MAPKSKGQSGWTCIGQTPTMPVCSWAALICDSTGFVTDVLLNGLYLTGSIPTNIGLATSITHMELNDNSLRGTIPSGLRLLQGLMYLDLSRNSLTSTIPDVFNDITTLKYLSLSDNSLSGTVPRSVCEQSDLTSFYVERNELSCNYWDCLSYVPDLKLGTLRLCTSGT